VDEFSFREDCPSLIQVLNLHSATNDATLKHDWRLTQLSKATMCVVPGIMVEAVNSLFSTPIPCMMELGEIALKRSHSV
jgi:hypothetical protein